MSALDREEMFDIQFRKSALRLMQEKNISYRDLERLTGIDFSALHKYIRIPEGDEHSHKNRRVTIGRAVVIANALGSTVEDMIVE